MGKFIESTFSFQSILIMQEHTQHDVRYGFPPGSLKEGGHKYGMNGDRYNFQLLICNTDKVDMYSDL